MIKWPNDIIANNKKLCGILTEGAMGNAVVGIGVNLNSTHFPEDIAHKATSLKLLTKNTCNPIDICREIATEVFNVFDKTKGRLDPDTIATYTRLCANIGKEVQSDSGCGIALGIDCDGGLIVSTQTGNIRISHGEVTVTDIY